jgi:hypothetical protein
MRWRSARGNARTALPQRRRPCRIAAASNR